MQIIVSTWLDSYNSEMVFDLPKPEIDGKCFGSQDWINTIYGGWSGDILSNKPYCRDLDSSQEPLSTHIIPTNNLPENQGQSFYFIWIMTWYIGPIRIRPASRQALLVQSLLQWKNVVNPCKVSDTHSGWWGLHATSLHIYILTINKYYPTQTNHSLF